MTEPINISANTTFNEDVKRNPRPLQIIEIAEQGSQFELKRENLDAVFNQIPANLKVAVVSVVGAFRTGKSFLLDLFLRYLRYYDDPQHANEVDTPSSFDGNAPWLTCDHEQEGLEGRAGASEQKGFTWRPGRDRCTTGIWMWSKPFIRRLPDASGTPGKGEKIAVLILDTQGMFDSETTQMLTASIFGLSTLLSSHQIYNVVKHIQEDHLQHLSLFSEYGRIALRGRTKTSPSSSTQDNTDDEEDIADIIADSPTATRHVQPFQRLEFLVRDAVMDKDALAQNDFRTIELDNQVYLDSILSKTQHQDLRDIRDHIQECFETLTCFQMPHPGFEVAEESQYKGNIEDIRTIFRQCLERFVFNTFNTHLTPKRIHGRDVNAAELKRFIRVYCKLFHDGDRFPQARVLLAATAEANNRNAVDEGFAFYCGEMEDTFKRTNYTYLETKDFAVAHEKAKHVSLEEFDEMANFGSNRDIQLYKDVLCRKIDKRRGEYAQLNDQRNNWKNAEYYVIALAILIGAFVVRTMLDLTCSGWSDTCSRMSEFASFVISLIIFVGFVLSIATGHSLFRRFKRLIHVGAQVAGAAVSAAASEAGQAQLATPGIPKHMKRRTRVKTSEAVRQPELNVAESEQCSQTVTEETTKMSSEMPAKHHISSSTIRKRTLRRIR